jgi:hypothetical protein
MPCPALPFLICANMQVVIKVSDEGGGIKRSNMNRIWSYLYTTADPAILDRMLGACTVTILVFDPFPHQWLPHITLTLYHPPSPSPSLAPSYPPQAQEEMTPKPLGTSTPPPP